MSERSALEHVPVEKAVLPPKPVGPQIRNNPGKQPEITRLRRAIADLSDALQRGAPTVPAHALNLRLALEAAKRLDTQPERTAVSELEPRAQALLGRATQPKAAAGPLETSRDSADVWDIVSDIVNDAIPGVGDVIMKSPRLYKDIAESILMSPLYGKQVFREQWEDIADNFQELLHVTAGLIASQIVVASLVAAPEPTMGSKIVAIVLEAFIIAFAVYGAVTAGQAVLELGNTWWSLVSKANGDQKTIAAAALTFTRMIYALVQAYAALVGLKRAIKPRAPAEPSGSHEPQPTRAPPEPAKPAEATKPAHATETHPTPVHEVPKPANTKPVETSKTSAPKSQPHGAEHPATKDGAAKPASSERVTHAVPGLFSSTKGAPPAGWTIVTRTEQRGMLRTSITAPNGAEGSVLRSYDPAKRQWTMHEAFFDEKLPKWIESETPMVAGRGTPLIAYLDMRLMNEFEIQFGSLKSAKMSTIENIEAICQLEAELKKGATRDQAVRRTGSFSYAETELVQSGHQILDVKMTGGVREKFEVLLEFQEERNIISRDRVTQMLKKYGLSRTDQVWIDYDIQIDLGPAKGKP